MVQAVVQTQLVIALLDVEIACVSVQAVNFTSLLHLHVVIIMFYFLKDKYILSNFKKTILENCPSVSSSYLSSSGFGYDDRQAVFH